MDLGEFSISLPVLGSSCTEPPRFSGLQCCGRSLGLGPRGLGLRLGVVGLECGFMEACSHQVAMEWSKLPEGPEDAPRHGVLDKPEKLDEFSLY